MKELEVLLALFYRSELRAWLNTTTVTSEDLVCSTRKVTSDKKIEANPYAVSTSNWVLERSSAHSLCECQQDGWIRSLSAFSEHAVFMTWILNTMILAT
ncbi:hypothetical protein RRG08_059789 [Elysia crispata]|uniref:Uncharacterized protein n=1 Tax=Elysia crispata TaxID=231223 RepID=A0AAE1EEL8_9GAST|nr:hypothetical protein RRG08_059789 [Elysia crispata]